MGNSISNNSTEEKQFKNFYEIIDFIATKYILTMDFKSLTKLSEEEYCNKLVVITSDIIEKFFNDMEITYLAQRTKDGLIVNEQTNENLLFIDKERFNELDASNGPNKDIRKKRICKGIAKFYIKIAHIFSAILTTINPIYTYKDETGQNIKVEFKDKDKIPSGVERKLYKINICDNRIRSLLKPNNNLNPDILEDEVTLHPSICDINVLKDKEGIDKTLEDEPGIPELMHLYYDNYDYSTGEFNGMTSQTKQKFMTDLKLFYTTFTGEKTMPEYIKKFSDIKLRAFQKKESCNGNDSYFRKEYKINKKDKLFIDYAKNIKNMMENASNNQYKLLSVINDIFTFVIDPHTKEKVIRVNPRLNDKILQNVVEKTRKLIINLYISCEMDYIKGVKLYEAIVESKIVETTKNQINSLEKNSSDIVKENDDIIIKNNIQKLNESLTPNVNAMDKIEEDNKFQFKNPSNVNWNQMNKIREDKLNQNPVPNFAANPVPNFAANPVPNFAANPVPTLAANPVPNLAANPVPNLAANPVPNLAPNPVPNLAPNPVPNLAPNPVPNLAPNQVPNSAQKFAPNPMLNQLPNSAQKFAQNPMLNPAQNPTENPAQNFAANLARNPMQNPVQNPVQNPAQKSDIIFQPNPEQNFQPNPE